jgi:hypothetical protein
MNYDNINTISKPQIGINGCHKWARYKEGERNVYLLILNVNGLTYIVLTKKKYSTNIARNMIISNTQLPFVKSSKVHQVKSVDTKC